jgi:uncharacterized protein (TIGR02145 family)
VGWWPFNGNASDESGNGNNGTVNGATLTTDRFGNANKAFSFDGINDWINMPSGGSTSLNITSNFTLSFWFKTTQGTNAGLIGFGDNVNGNGGYLVAVGNGTVNNPNGKLTAMTGVNWYTGANQVIDNKWHFASVVLNLNSLTFIIDNVIDASFSGAQPPVSFNGLRAIAARNNGLAGYFNGQIDDIGTWNRALTQQEITNLYNAGPFDISAANTTICSGQTANLSVQSLTGTITALNCASATNSGTLTAGTAASGVSSSIPYAGGNGGMHNGQTVTSTGVTGLTATLSAGTFASGSGSLAYAISGTPSGSGTASFALTIGGKSCTLSLTVTSNIASQYPTGSVFCASGPTAIVEVTNPTTGKTWMDRNLGASQAAISSTDANAYGDLYQWGRRSDGHQCRTSTTTTTLSSTDQPVNGNFIIPSSLPYDWRNPQNTNLWQGINGINNPCPNGYRLPTDSELDSEERPSWSSNNSVGAFSSPLKWVLAGYRNYSSGSFLNIGSNGYCWSSTIASTGSIYLVYNSTSASNASNMRANGMSVRCIKEIVGSIGALNCGSSSVTGNLISGTAASGVSVSIPYTAGNGGFYAAQSITSTGVTGLTASISQGLFASGTGNLIYTISGTPSADGTASFSIAIGGKSCTISISTLGSYYPAGSVFCAAGPTVIKDVTNPTTGKIWMDRNLGASQVATSSTDANSYGDLYQWGRRSDGHQCRTSPTTSALSSVDQPAHGNFILAPSSPLDWRSPQNVNLWQGVNGLNNPCPNGYRLPTEIELNTERTSWSNNNNIGAFASNLKFTLAGHRYFSNGATLYEGTFSYYWSSNVNNVNSRYLYFEGSNAYIGNNYRANGFSVRCIKN